MKQSKRSFVVGGLALFALFSVAISSPYFFESRYQAQFPDSLNMAAATGEVKAVTHLPTPTPLKALYMTACVAGTPSWRADLKHLIETTELNAIVIDIKDYSGNVSFPNSFPQGTTHRGCTVSDLTNFIASLHESSIYVIGRISVFQDPSYTSLFPELAVKSKATGSVWKDRKGLSFVDVGAKPYWDYILQISRASYEMGFDELNFDYIRYPSDGDMSDTDFTWTGTSTRAAMLESFFSYLHDNLKPSGVMISADLFGMTTTVTNDMGIGQVLEKTLPYFDYVAPMVYPSHYPATWHGFANPAEHPYEVVNIALTEGKRREEVQRITMGIATSTPSKLRPWLQDFNLGATYGPDKVQAQIQATYDSGLSSWMIWSAANKYTVTALLSDTSTLRAEH